MAFQTSRPSTTNNMNKAVATTTESSSTSINLGGVYDGKPDSKLVLKGGKLRDAITIPAGYTLKVFKKGGKSKNGKDLPPYEIVAQAPRSM